MTPAPSDGLRELYERRAELQYAEPPPLPDPRLDRKWERTLELLAEHLPCEAFLDAGCGDGRFLAALPGVGPVPARVVGTDLSERILATARATAARAGVESELVQANLETLPFADGSFDLILCSQTIEHLVEPALGVRELARVLAPRGTLLLTTMSSRARITQALNLPRTALVRLFRLQARNVELPVPEAEFAPDELAAEVRAAGLAVERVETFRFHLRPPLDRPRVRRALAALDRRLPAHGYGDILVVVATQPAVRPAAD